MSRDLIMAILGMAVLVSSAYLVIETMPRSPAVVVYACDLAEISPDFPNDVKQKCRKAQHEKVLH